MDGTWRVASGGEVSLRVEAADDGNRRSQTPPPKSYWLRIGGEFKGKVTPKVIFASVILLYAASTIVVVPKLHPTVRKYAYVFGPGVLFGVLFVWFIFTTNEIRIQQMKLEVTIFMLCFTTLFGAGVDSLPADLDVWPNLALLVATFILVVLAYWLGRIWKEPEYGACLTIYLLGFGLTIVTTKLTPHISMLIRCMLIFVSLSTSVALLVFLDSIDALPHNIKKLQSTSAPPFARRLIRSNSDSALFAPRHQTPLMLRSSSDPH